MSFFFDMAIFRGLMLSKEAFSSLSDMLKRLVEEEGGCHATVLVLYWSVPSEGGGSAILLNFINFE